MRTFKNLRLLAISTLFVVGLGSCLKTSDPDFALSGGAYLMQRASSTFTPYVFIQPNFNYTLSTASMTGAGYTFPFHKIGYLMETNPDAYNYPYLTQIPNGNFAVTATNTEGTTATLSFTFDIKDSQIMGDLNVKKFEYSVTNGIVGEWDTVNNATSYRLSITPIYTDSYGNSVVALPETQFVLWNENNVKATSGKITTFPGATAGATYRIAVAAFSGSTFPNMMVLQDTREAKNITWGKD